mgnify:CR=1 FL=1
MRLEVKNLRKSYGDDTVVDDINLAIKPGELVGLVGPNGAGKSTTLNMICGILPPDSGIVLVDGLNPTENPTKFRSKIAFVPERPGLHPNVACYDFLRFTADAHQKPESEIGPCALLAGCRTYLHKPMSVLSRGQRQAVYLAAAFIAQPTLLVLDEPTVGLDPLQQKNILAALRTFCDNGGSVLLSTHALYEAENVCDRICVLMNKKIIADGTAADVAREHPSLFEFLNHAYNESIGENIGEGRA